MITQIFVVVAIAASASAIATSYAVGGLPLGGLEGGLGLGRIGGLGLGRIGGIGLEGGIGGIGLGGGIGGIGLGGGRLIGGHERVVDVYTPPRYQFKYGVGDPKTGDHKEQAEARVGDVVRGEYSLAEPDGTIRVVKYTADDHNGFNAVVSRIGHAAHPQVLLRGGLGLGGIGLGHGY
ncbi:hypothetical protein MTP99_009981 [Tenebrio molitor]|nr:hypothetical protein MTP99_009981 [Tenebrio molitor]